MAATHCGTCGACEGVFRVTRGVLHKHGYQRPYGRHREVGRCFGAMRLPHEVSPEVAEEWLASVRASLALARGRLKALNDGEVTEFRDHCDYPFPHTEISRPDLPDWRAKLSYKIHEEQLRVEELELEESRTRRRVEGWVAKPLIPVDVATGAVPAKREAV